MLGLVLDDHPIDVAVAQQRIGLAAVDVGEHLQRLLAYGVEARHDGGLRRQLQLGTLRARHLEGVVGGFQPRGDAPHPLHQPQLLEAREVAQIP
jgi:hypothetical protein